MNKYDHKKIEPKWQKKWEEDNIYKTGEDREKPKYYVLDMFPYPSGAGLHVGHPKGYIATDILARAKMMQGFNVLHPMGWDAFGLPAENYALKNKVHPRGATEKNVAVFKEQINKLGLGYDWEREINTTDPEYYKWTQWAFLKMFEKGLAYESHEPINWCPSCKTGLANEDLEDGRCERCDSEIEQKPMRQWVLRITAYADRLLDDLQGLPDWEDSIKEMQRNWIGRSEGAEVVFKIKRDNSQSAGQNARTGVKLGFKTQLNPRAGVLSRALACFGTDRTRTTWFLTFPTKKRKIMFETKEECSEMVKLISEACERNHFDLHEAVVMEDHVHLILDTDRDIKIDKILKNIKGYCAKKFLDKFEYYCENSKGRHLWTPKGDYEIIEEQKRYDEILDYVRKNPEKDGFKKENRLFSVVKPGFKTRLNNGEEELRVFTTRPDTLFGCTYMAVAPEHKILTEHKDNIENWDEIEAYIRQANKKTAMERGELNKDKTGVKIEGLSAINPVNDEEIPIFVADYVLMGYGFGAVMAVPAHDERDFEFARKYGLKIKQVVKNNSKTDGCFTEDGVSINSFFLDGLETKDAKKKMIVWLEENKLGRRAVNYKLKDWVFSRQRYWGEPIPIIHCEKCGAVAVPEKDLPVRLPDVEHYEPTGTGESPLANIENWVNVRCPKCGDPAKRETNTMPQWAGSSWYYLRYIDPKNDKNLADKEKEKYWSPVDFYVGGAEHATRHLIYARFWHKFLYDICAVSCNEPFKKLRHVGLVLAEDGRKMSKRWGNVINPDDVVEAYGADAMRVYEMFMGPFSQPCAWSASGLSGTRKFLEKIWKARDSVKDGAVDPREVKSLIHKTIRKAGADIEDFKFNTAVSAMMILANKISEQKEISRAIYEIFLKILSPFAPHFCEELWEDIGHKESIFKEAWPVFNPELAKDEKINLIVQVNGKVRDGIEVSADISEEYAKKIVLESEKVRKWIEGKEIRKIVYIKGRLVSIVVQ